MSQTTLEYTNGREIVFGKGDGANIDYKVPEVLNTKILITGIDDKHYGQYDAYIVHLKDEEENEEKTLFVSSKVLKKQLDLVEEQKMFPCLVKIIKVDNYYRFE